MPVDPLTIAMVQQGLQTGSELAMANYNDRRQLRQAGKLQAKQIEGSKELTKFNQAQALKMWQDTNYSAQTNEMRKAGLSVGLMYGKGGPGGTTQVSAGNVQGQGTQGGNAQTPNVGMGMQLGLNAALQKAQIENIQASTAQIQAQTEKTSGVDTAEASGRIAKLAQETKNAEISAELMKLDGQLKEIETKVQAGTAEERIKSASIGNEQMMKTTNRIIQETRSAEAKGSIDQATAGDIITQVKRQTIEQSLRIELAREGVINLTADTAGKYAAIGKIAEEIIRMQEQTKQGQQGLDQDQQKIILDMLRTEFGTGTSAEIVRWLNAIVPFTGQ